jgi:ferrous iron transport protein B
LSGRLIALAGNPNVGKSALFNALTGAYAQVSNYPGTTLELAAAPWDGGVLVDTPGVFGLSGYNDEERVARDILLRADAVIAVAAAPSLERDLFCVLQLADLGVPLVVALNQMDEARRRGLTVDGAALAADLGVPVVEVVAVRGWGVPHLRRALDAARPARTGAYLDDATRLAQERRISLRRAVLILEGDGELAGAAGVAPGSGRERIYRRRAQRAAALARQIVMGRGGRGACSDRMGRWLLRPAVGFPALAAVLAVLYLFLGWFVGQRVVGFTEGVLWGDWVAPVLRRLMLERVGAGGLPEAVLVGPHGLLTATAGYLLGLLLPLVFSFYLALGFLEDSGYLPRLATLLDRAMEAVGLNGKAVIPFVLGLGCVTMATLSTRLLSTRRERTIATALLALAVPCSAQTAVILGLLAPLGPRFLALYALSLLGVFLAAGFLLRETVPGRTAPLLLDLPPLRWPRPGNIWRKAAARSGGFLREATPYFCYGNLGLALLAQGGMLTRLEAFLQPMTQGFLGLPARAARAFLLAMIRRDLGAAGLLGLHLDPGQTVVAALTVTLFLPCLPSLLLIFKERGWREALLIWLGTLTAALAVGRLAAWLLVR